MESERWEQVKGVLGEALERPPEDRTAFLHGACGGDVSLFEEVRSMLEVEAGADDFIEAPAIARRQEDEVGEDGLPRERRMGAYELERCLGRGGMGVVYLARRADQEYDQRVAIKVVKRGMDTDEIVARFRHERQILAQLDHPSIARLYDGGTTSDGLPFFVMEYVEGEPIREYCRSRGLDTKERLRLFCEVCEAVQFAHRNLVVHRDLKPANILVTKAGTAKLLDFGIARLLGPDGTSALTRQIGTLPLTPEYASPEQLRCEPVTTVSDVYSLGVLLYELLTGQRPFDDVTSTDALIEATRKRVPEKPSSAVSRRTRQAGGDREQARELRRHLKGDLDYIALKALRRDPGERYASAQALAEDIERHLTGHPILARQGARLYVFSRLLRRRWRSLTATAVAIALPATLLYSKAEQTRANREVDRAETTEEILRSIFSSADPTAIGDRLTVSELLERSIEIVEKSEADPRSRAELLAALGDVSRNLGDFDRAERLFRESLSLRQEEFGRNHPLVGLSLDGLAMALRSKDEVVEAEKLFREAIAIGRRSDPEHLPVYLNNLAGLLRDTGSLRESISLYEESLAMKRKQYGKNTVNEDIATTLNNLGSALLAVGDYDMAEPYLRDALKFRQEHGSTASVATTLHSLGVLYRDQGELEKAEHYLTMSLERRKEVFAPDHYRIATVLKNLAVCKQLQGKWAEADADYRQALEMQRHAWPDGNSEIAITLREMSQLAVEQGDAKTGEAYAREALGILRPNFKEDHWLIADAKSVLGGALLAQGNLEEAKPLIEEGYAGLVAVKGPKIRWSREAKQRLTALEEALKGAD